MKHSLIIVLALILFASCTENQKAKNFGGSAVLKLPLNEKLVNAAWKSDDLWYLTRPMQKQDIAETYIFKEESSFGLMQGSYTIIESKTKEDTAEIILHGYKGIMVEPNDSSTKK